MRKLGGISDVMIDIEEHLMKGFKPETIAAMLLVPLKWVHDVEDSLMQLADPRFYGPDYDE